MEGQWLLVRWSVRYLESRHFMSQHCHLCSLATHHFYTPVFASLTFFLPGGNVFKLSGIPYPAGASRRTILWTISIIFSALHRYLSTSRHHGFPN